LGSRNREGFGSWNGNVGCRWAGGFLVHDFGARVAALRLVGGAAPRVVAVDDAVGDDVLFCFFDADETHAGRCDAASRCDRDVIRAPINVGLRDG
jgi:hypothetical protein